MKKHKTKTLLGFFALVLLAVIGGLHLAQGPKPTPPATSTPKARPVSVAVPAAKPVAVAHPSEAELNALGLSLAGGLTVRVGGKAETEQKGEPTK